MTTSFRSFGLPETLITALDKINFTTPTPIQAQSIPPALAGQDVLGTASTGTGKTAAFALPMMTHLINNPKSVALVMTPTRELATQIMTTIQPLRLMHKDLYTACLIGGESINKQLGQLDRRPRLIVGTPGRINDHLERGSLWLDRADFLVLDETDRMLDLGFDVQIATIIAKMAKPRQTLMFSATMPKEIVALSGQYLKNPKRITIGEVNKPAAKIKSTVIETTEAGKFDALTEQLNEREGSIVVFVKTRYGTEKLAKKLRTAGHGADAIHGDLQQRKRDRVIADFRDKRFRILVATDVAARGLDIPHIEHVINHDLPQVAEDYIHRIGRTARAGAEGEAVSLVTPAEFSKWRAIQQLINPEENRNARATRTADKNSPRRATGKKPGGKKFGDRFERADSRDFGDRKKSFGGQGGRKFADRDSPRGGDRQQEQRAGRSPWESKRSAPQAEKGARKTYGRNPFNRKDELGEVYQDVRRQADEFRNERPSEGRYEGRRDDNRRSGGFRDRDDRRPARGHDDRRPARGDFRDRDDRRPMRDDDRRPARAGGFRDRDDRRPAGRDDDRRPARADDRRSFGKPSGGKPSGGKSFGGQKRSFGKPSGSAGAGRGKPRGRWAA